jgi:hypothetical protein
MTAGLEIEESFEEKEKVEWRPHWCFYHDGARGFMTVRVPGGPSQQNPTLYVDDDHNNHNQDDRGIHRIVLADTQ